MFQHFGSCASVISITISLSAQLTSQAVVSAEVEAAVLSGALPCKMDHRYCCRSGEINSSQPKTWMRLIACVDETPPRRASSEPSTHTSLHFRLASRLISSFRQSVISSSRHRHRHRHLLTRYLAQLPLISVA